MVGKEATAAAAFWDWLKTPPPESSSPQALLRYQYEVERRCADAIRSTAPFSEERQRITQAGYRAVDQLIARRCQDDDSSFGAQAQYCALLDRLLVPKFAQKKQGVFFEAGVGTGKILRHVAQTFPDVTVTGCDVYLERYYLGELADGLYEDTLYNTLRQLPDGSIDVFYWNDVMEHIPYDEIQATLAQIARKLAPGGLLVTITPNRIYGPSDITGLVHPNAGEARGLHLHEYCFYEIRDLMKAAGLQDGPYIEERDGAYQIETEHAAARSDQRAFYERLASAGCRILPLRLLRRCLQYPVRRFIGSGSVFVKEQADLEG